MHNFKIEYYKIQNSLLVLIQNAYNQRFIFLKILFLQIKELILYSFERSLFRNNYSDWNYCNFNLLEDLK